eukprot:TRINITY_DN20145_c0_g1_i1.p1 TRINITY_DN20145_c0_g1~~TRINITY_DN20145_c0_g1_i1.p1  ORF type:complete len:432 (+),score=84.38 TRINITY_DN20145_c0_g1_i1:47-1297(+)
MPPLVLLALATSVCSTLDVAPEDEAAYELATRDDVFRCFDESRAVPLSYLNDNFCDCSDGSDEPNTPACSGLPGRHFYCRNLQSIPRLIYASRVGDGICDCCDGSDESVFGPHACENTCEAEGSVLHPKREARKQSIREGVRLRQELESSAEQDAIALQSEKSGLEQELARLQTQQNTEQQHTKPPALFTKGEGDGSYLTSHMKQGKDLAALQHRVQPEVKASEYARWALTQDGLQAEVPTTTPSAQVTHSEQTSESAGAGCWIGEYANSKDKCCDLQHGPQGMPSCWDESFSYDKCCLGDRTLTAALSSTTQKPDHIIVHLEQVADSPSAIDLEASRKKMRQLKGRLFSLEKRLRPLEHGGPRWLTLGETCVQKRLEGKEYNICFFGDAKQSRLCAHIKQSQHLRTPVSWKMHKF